MSAETGIVAVLGSDGEPVGGGCLITAGFAATCAHVVADALGHAAAPKEPPLGTLRLRFPFLAQQPECEARVVHWCPEAPPGKPRGYRDIAILRLDRTPPAARTATLARSGQTQRGDCRVHGFPRSGEHWVYGVARDARSDGWLQITGENDFSYFIEPGFSGSPVTLISDELEVVIGIIVVREKAKDKREAFVIPAAFLEQALDACGEDDRRTELDLLHGALRDLQAWFDDHRPNDPQLIRAAETGFKNLARALDDVACGRTAERIGRLAAKRDALDRLQREAAEHQQNTCFQDLALERLLGKLQGLAGVLHAIPCDPQGLIPNDYRDEPAHWQALEELLAEIEALEARLEQNNRGLSAEDATRLLDALGDLKAELLYKAIDPARLVAIRERLDQIRAAADLLQRVILLHEVFLGCYAELLPPKAIFRDREDTPALVVIPAGRFLMGSPEDEEGRNYSEGPQHEVTISRRFALGRCAVTFEEYDCFADTTGRQRPNDRDWGRGRRPVINVSWEDAQAYIDWLSKEAHRPYRLPSEAEWEYACRAATATRYSWGEDITRENANHGRTVGRTTEVGSYPANLWGLHDMHGNIWEWVEDCWNDNYEGAPNDGTPWLESDCARRVVRGGSWVDYPGVLRSTIRDRNHAYGGREDDLGFRVARTLTP